MHCYYRSVELLALRVSFKIKSSKRSNNGTDVGSGQIPEILYRIPEMEKETVFQVQLLDRSFSTTVSAVSLGLCGLQANLNSSIRFLSTVKHFIHTFQP